MYETNGEKNSSRDLAMELWTYAIGRDSSSQPGPVLLPLSASSVR